jgi:hypothetical protein
MPGEDRDRLFEKALAQQLRRAAAYDAAACLDPETLAAYHERLLSAEEMSTAKNHLVACARCQEILAQLEATQEVVDLEDQRKVPVSMQAKGGALRDAIAEEPDLLASRAAAPAAAKGKVVELATKRGAMLRWAAPIGAIAAVLLLWVGVSEFRTQHRFSEQATQVAERGSENGRRQESEPASPAFERQKNEAVARDELKEQAAASPRSTAKSPSEDPGSVSALHAPLRAGSKTEKKSPAAPQATTRELADAAKPSSGFGVGSGEAPSIEKPKQEEVAQAKSDGVEAIESRRDTLDADKKLQAAAGALSGVAAAPPPAPSLKAKQSAAESVEVSSANVLSKDANDKRAYSTVALAGGLATPFSVEAPGGKSVWRFGDQGAIFHSKNSGKAWESQISGVTAKLTTGSSPSEKVCWIAGANGTLLRTTNGGKHWQLVITPIAGDLGGVHSTDANHASIWDAPNRASYQTADGGVSWQRTANE